MFFINKTLIIIVLYNERLASSASFNSLIKCKEELNIYVYDNSALSDESATRYPFVTYVHNPANPGVSTAYNSGAKFAQQNAKNWLLLLDQDTILPNNFVEMLEQQMNNQPESDLFAMRLLKNENLISPCGYKYKRGYALSEMSAGRNAIKHITFLNSGLIISVDLFLKAGGYDPNVPLYFSDFVFVNRLRKLTDYFVLLPINLTHNLSSDDMSNIPAFKVRYDLYIKGAIEAKKSENDGGGYYYLAVLLRAVKLSLLLGDKYYIKSFFKKLY